MMAIKPPDYERMQKPHSLMQKVTARKLRELIGEYLPEGALVQEVGMSGRPSCIYNVFVHASPPLTEAENVVLEDMLEASLGDWYRNRYDYYERETFFVSFSPSVQKYFLKPTDEPGPVV